MSPSGHRAACLCLLVSGTGCIDTKIVDGLPSEIEWVAAISFYPNRTEATALLPIDRGFGVSIRPDADTHLIGYEAGVLEAIDPAVLEALRNGELAVPLEATTECLRGLPAPTWVGTLDGSRWVEDTSVEIPPLTADWLRSGCEDVSGDGWLLDTDCFGHVFCSASSRQDTEECTVDATVYCPPLTDQTMKVQVSPMGRLCVTDASNELLRFETSEDQAVDGALVEWEGSECRMRVYPAALAERQWGTVDRRIRVIDDPLMDRGLGDGLTEIRDTYGTWPGYATQLTLVGDRLFMAGYGGAFIGDCHELESTLIELDALTGERIRTSSQAPCLEVLEPAPESVGLLASTKSGQDQMSLARLGEDHQVLDRVEYDVSGVDPEAEEHQAVDMVSVPTETGFSIYVLITSSYNLGGEFTTSSLIARIDQQNGRFGQVIVSGPFGDVSKLNNFRGQSIRAMEWEGRMLLAVQEDSNDRMRLLDPEIRRGSEPVTIDNVHLAGRHFADTIWDGHYFYTAGLPERSAGGEMGLGGPDDEYYRSIGYFNRHAGVQELAAWPSDPRYLLATTVHDDLSAGLSVFDTLEQRFLPGEQTIGDPTGEAGPTLPAKEALFGPDGRLWLLFAWDAELLRITLDPLD